MQKLSDRITRRNIIVIALVVILIAIAGTCWSLLFSAPTASEPREDAQWSLSALASSWSKGNVIVFIRHAERCDRSDAPCLDDPEGITVRGKDQALAIGRAFEKLGVQRTDVFASPATRTKQTASFIFKAAATESEGMSNCKTVTLDDISPSKATGRNLVLVTHSHCIERLERLLNVTPFKDTGYDSLLFVSIDEGTKRPILAKFLHAEQFIAAFQP